MPDDAAATVRQFEILHGGEEHLGLHLDSLCKQLPGARSKDIRQGIIDLVGLTKPNNTAILVHGVSLSLRGSGRLDTRLDTPPISYRHHPVSRLARAAVADRDDVLPAGHILRAGELQNEGLIERRNGGEVEAVQALYGWEPRLLDPTLHHASFAVDQFQFGQAQQKADMIDRE